MSKEIDAVEMSAEEKNATVRKYENDILAGLLEAASYKTNDEDIAKIQVKRHGAVVLEFRIRPLSEEEYQNCKRRNTNFKRNKQLGTRVAESVEVARYRSELIYEATVEEDRDKIWNNREAWNKLAVLNGIDLIEVVLKSGEKDAILEKLDEISGYQPTVEDVAKKLIKAGGKGTLLHIIFQRHHIAPDDFLLKPKWAQAFMLESMKVQLKIEEERRNGTDTENEEEGGG